MLTNLDPSDQLRPDRWRLLEALYWATMYARAGLPLVPLCWPHAGRCAWHTRQYTMPPGDGVVACRVGRTPLSARFANEPLESVAEVAALWRDHPTAGPGVALWRAGLVQLDLDGPGALLEAHRRGLPEPHLIIATTRPEGGWHVLWARQPGVPLAYAREVLPGGGRIELDSQGIAPLPPAARLPDWSYLRWIGPALGEVAVPANNRDNTNSVRVLPMFALAPPTPPWAADMLRRARDRKVERQENTANAGGVAAAPPDRPRRELSARMRALLDIGPHAQPGRYASGSEALWALACSMARAGWALTEAEAALLAAPWVVEMVGRRGGVGWLRRDLARAYRSAFTQAVGRNGRILLGE